MNWIQRAVERAVERLKKWLDKIGTTDGEPVGGPVNPETPPTPETPPETQTAGAMTEEEAKAYAQTIQFLEGSKRDDPKAIEMLMRFGKSVTHFGGGATPTTPFSEESLWKPISDSSGKLVVITPHSCNAISVTIGNEKQTSRSIGNGWRCHFRFSKPGASYGSPTIVIEGAGTAKISNGGARQSFKIVAG